MARSQRGLLLLVCTACLAAAGAGVEAGAARGAADWLGLAAGYAREGAGAGSAGGAGDADDGWFPRPVPITLPIGRGADGRPAALPVLILPLPVPAPAPARAAQCSAARYQDKPSYDTSPAGGGSYEGEALHSPPPPLPTPPAAAPQWAAGPARRPHFESRASEPAAPHLDYIVSSQQLVELYQAQVAPSAELPPALIPDYAAGQEAAAAEGAPPRHVRLRRYQRQSQYRPLGGASPAPFATSPPPTSAAPPAPSFGHSFMLRGELTVPRAGYTEPYTVWWDAASGAARVDLHGGATAAYRTVLPDGRVQDVEVRVDRSGESEVRRCSVAAPRSAGAGDRAPPALPDLQEFSFAGLADAEHGRVERWTRTVSGNSGELGAARGEALTFHHELLLTRAPDNYTTTPLRYSVSVDSSVLGPNCDGYVHRYTELRDQQHEPAMLRVDLAEACEATEAARRERAEPLREYTLPHRDPRRDDDYQRFKTAHGRRYADDTEEAVRKAVLLQHARFVDSGNRQGATFSMEVNHLGDRLDEELRVLRGVREDGGGGGGSAPAEPFPHSRDQLAAMRGRLPRAFDWRERGAVTHVRNQGSCSSCWAFAVAGAVEGALFVRTRRLVALSEQCLVDCAHPFGGRGCGGTWPSAAYDYVAERGLPALQHYAPYQAKVLPCADRRVSPVTLISSHVNVTRHSVQALKVAIRRHGPTVVIIDSTAKSFVFYKAGVINDDRCAKNKAEHAVLAVGWGERQREPHIVLKNSWSAAWGDGGYVRLAAAPNTCGVLARASYPRLERADVRRVPDATDAPDAPDAPGE